MVIRGLVLVCTVLIAGAGRPDTIYFKDGSILHGKTEVVDDKLLLTFPQGTLGFNLDSVARVEKNDLVTGINLSGMRQGARDNKPVAVVKVDALDERQEEKIRRLVLDMSGSSGFRREIALSALVQMNERGPVFEYLTELLPFFENHAEPIMTALGRMDPDGARPMIRGQAFSRNAMTRAAAVAWLGEGGTAEDTPLLARGLGDEETAVSLAAAEALAEHQDRRATPALIAGLSDGRPEVRNACRVALLLIWPEEATTRVEDAQDPAQWMALWKTLGGRVRDPVDPAGLRPLTAAADDERDPGPRFDVH